MLIELGGRFGHLCVYGVGVFGFEERDDFGAQVHNIFGGGSVSGQGETGEAFGDALDAFLSPAQALRSCRENTHSTVISERYRRT